MTEVDRMLVSTLAGPSRTSLPVIEVDGDASVVAIELLARLSKLVAVPDLEGTRFNTSN
jgi:hypothetical protein